MFSYLHTNRRNRMGKYIVGFFCTVQYSKEPMRKQGIIHLLISSQAASLLANRLPIAAIMRQTIVRPPIIYHHWLLLISVVQEKNSVPKMASKQETEPSTTLMPSTGRGKIACLRNHSRSRK